VRPAFCAARFSAGSHFFGYLAIGLGETALRDGRDRATAAWYRRVTDALLVSPCTSQDLCKRKKPLN
jgi:hypothetical protein